MSLRVAILGCGAIGRKRALALGEDALVGCFDVDAERARALARDLGGEAAGSLDALLALEPDVVVVATTHEHLADGACAALAAGAHVLVEKPAGIGTADVERIADAQAAAADRVVKVGFNHRFHPAIARAAAEAGSGRFGPALYVRARYGHGGRRGYEREWRARFASAGGGELVDQGMHLLDLSHWILGPLPLHSALLRTQFWDAEVDDNAALILGERDSRDAPWALLHVSWTEWKNTFSLEICCRDAKLAVDGLTGSYGPQRLRIYAMRPELGPPDLEELAYPPDDVSWPAEWAHLRALVAGEATEPLGSLDSARYAWACVEAAYADSPYAAVRGA